jgi:phosphoserine aminotransferase
MPLTVVLYIKVTVEKEDRSLMNATFLLTPNLNWKDAFMEACTEAGCVGVSKDTVP